MTLPEVDRIDHQLLRLLYEDGRRTLSEMAPRWACLSPRSSGVWTS